jgi:hypothetical protein
MVATPAYWVLAQGAGHHYTAMVATDPELPRPDYTTWDHHPEYNERNIIVDPARLATMLAGMTNTAPTPALQPAPAILAEGPKPVTRQITVIANCHCLPLADALALGGRGITTDFIDVTFAGQPHMVSKIDAMLAGGPDDIVFSFNLSSQFDRLETPKLHAALGTRLHTFTNIHFNGLHPDITYIGALGRRFTGYFGDYHSKIALFSFVTGRSVQDCMALFNGNFYERAGYYGAFAQAEQELLHRDQTCETKFAAEFVSMLREELSLYTVNHPTGPVFLRLAAALAAATGVDFVHMPALLFQNHLSTNLIWPVYDEIATAHNLPYRTPMVFFRTHGRASRSATLEEFIAGSYAAYNQADPAEFIAMVKRLPFFSTFEAIS